VRQCPETLPAPALASAIAGLPRLGASWEARQLLAALTPRVMECRDKLELRAFGNALYEFEGLGDSEEVLDFLGALDPLMLLHGLDLHKERTRFFAATVHEW
jgi:hypothetical protein